MIADRTQDSRWSIYAEVRPYRAEHDSSWIALNISRSGVFISGTPLLKRGSCIDAVIDLSGAFGPGVELTARLEVIWSRAPGAATPWMPPGMGCRFVELDEKSQSYLAGYLEELSDASSSEASAFEMSSSREPEHQNTHVVDFRTSTISGQTSNPNPGLAKIEQGKSLAEHGQQTLGSYRMLEELGTGGMGDVFLAEHRLLGRYVAIKRLHEQFARDPLAVRRFFDEARLVNQISHPNIVEITDLGSEGTSLYYVMELIQGSTLLEEIRDSEFFDLDRILHIGTQLADALNAVHSAGIIHRDLKPDNILLTERHGQHDHVKLLDFGIAKLKSFYEGQRGQKSRKVIIGTPGYMSPEQIMGQKLDQRSDLYSLGVILYEMISGRRAFGNTSPGELMVKQVSQVPPLPRTATDGRLVPALLEDIVIACMQIDEGKRPSQATEILAALKAVSAELGYAA